MSIEKLKLNDKILFVGPFKQVRPFLLGWGGYLYIYTLGENHFLKAGMSSYIKSRLKDGINVQIPGISGLFDIKDILISGPFHDVNKKESELLTILKKNYRLVSSTREWFYFKGFIDDVVGLVPKE